MKNSNPPKLNGKAKIFYNAIKKLSQEQCDDAIMLSEWEESVGFNLCHTSGSDIELPHCLCGTKVGLSNKRYTNNRAILQNNIDDLYKKLDEEADINKRMIIEEEIRIECRKIDDNKNYIQSQKLNLTVFINRKTFKTVFIGPNCKTKFDNMVFNLSKTTNSKPKFTPLIKELEERYKITATTSEIYMFELFTLHYVSLSNHFEELKVDKRNYECRYKDLKHIESQIVEFLEQYGDTVVKIEQMDIHKNDINLMRNMKDEWEKYLYELQTYIKFIEETKIEDDRKKQIELEKLEIEGVLSKIINDKIKKYQKDETKMKEESKRLLCIRGDVISELNKQCLLLTNKPTSQPAPRIYNDTMKSLRYNTYLEIPYKNKDIFKSEFNGKYDIVNKLWYIANSLYTKQRKDYILKYIGYEVIWKLDLDCNIQVNNILEEENKRREEEEIKRRDEEEIKRLDEEGNKRRDEEGIKRRDEEMETCNCGIEIWCLCSCVNTKSILVKTKRKSDNLRRCCSCSKYKCRCISPKKK